MNKPKGEITEPVAFKTGAETVVAACIFPKVPVVKLPYGPEIIDDTAAEFTVMVEIVAFVKLEYDAITDAAVSVPVRFAFVMLATVKLP